MSGKKVMRKFERPRARSTEIYITPSNWSKALIKVEKDAKDRH